LHELQFADDHVLAPAEASADDVTESGEPL